MKHSIKKALIFSSILSLSSPTLYSGTYFTDEEVSDIGEYARDLSNWTYYKLGYIFVFDTKSWQKSVDLEQYIVFDYKKSWVRIAISQSALSKDNLNFNTVIMQKKTNLREAVTFFSNLLKNVKHDKKRNFVLMMKMQALLNQ